MNKYKIRRKIIDKIFQTTRCWGVFVKKITTADGQETTRLSYERQDIFDRFDKDMYIINFECTKSKFFAYLGICYDTDGCERVKFVRAYDNLTEILIHIDDIKSICTSTKSILKTDDHCLSGSKYISLDSYDNRQFFKYQLSCLSPISFIQAQLFDK